jgi:hypothetical protein
MFWFVRVIATIKLGSVAPWAMESSGIAPEILKNTATVITNLDRLTIACAKDFTPPVLPVARDSGNLTSRPAGRRNFVGQHFWARGQHFKDSAPAA